MAPGASGPRALICPRCGTNAWQRANRLRWLPGGAEGIGQAIASYLLDAGWHAGIVDLPNSRLEQIYRKTGRDVVLIEGDVADEGVAERAVAAGPRRIRPARRARVQRRDRDSQAARGMASGSRSGSSLRHPQSGGLAGKSKAYSYART
jgi:hypothetical protein